MWAKFSLLYISYASYLKSKGRINTEVTDSGLVIDAGEPCLGCHTDALVNISDHLVSQSSSALILPSHKKKHRKCIIKRILPTSKA